MNMQPNFALQRFSGPLEMQNAFLQGLPSAERWPVEKQIFTCPVCLFSCDTCSRLQAHFQVTDHKPTSQKMVVKNDPQPVKSGWVKSKPIKTMHFLNDYMKKADREPLIGLEYVTEYRVETEQDKFETKYKCEICDLDTDLVPMIQHLTGFKHRRHYLAKEYPYVLKAPCPSKDRALFVRRMALEIEQEEGTKMYKIDSATKMESMLTVQTNIEKQERKNSRWDVEKNSEERMKKALDYLENFSIVSESVNTIVTNLTKKLSDALKEYNAVTKEKTLFPVRLAKAKDVALAIMQNAVKSRPDTSKIIPTPQPQATLQSGPKLQATLQSGPKLQATLQSGPKLQATLQSGPKLQATLQSGPKLQSTLQSGPKLQATLQSGPKLQATLQSGPKLQATLQSGPKLQATLQSGPKLQATLQSGPKLHATLQSGPKLQATLQSGPKLQTKTTVEPQNALPLRKVTPLNLAFPPRLAAPACLSAPPQLPPPPQLAVPQQLAPPTHLTPPPLFSPAVQLIANPQPAQTLQMIMNPAESIMQNKNLGILGPLPEPFIHPIGMPSVLNQTNPIFTPNNNLVQTSNQNVSNQVPFLSSMSENTECWPQSGPASDDQLSSEDIAFFKKLKTLLQVLPAGNHNTGNNAMDSKLSVLKDLLLDKPPSIENSQLNHTLITQISSLSQDTMSTDNDYLRQQVMMLIAANKTQPNPQTQQDFTTDNYETIQYAAVKEDTFNETNYQRSFDAPYDPLPGDILSDTAPYKPHDMQDYSFKDVSRAQDMHPDDRIYILNEPTTSTRNYYPPSSYNDYMEETHSGLYKRTSLSSTLSGPSHEYENHRQEELRRREAAKYDDLCQERMMRYQSRRHYELEEPNMSLSPYSERCRDPGFSRTMRSSEEYYLRPSDLTERYPSERENRDSDLRGRRRNPERDYFYDAKRARLVDDHPRSPDINTEGLSADILKKIHGRDLFTVSAILNEYSMIKRGK